MSHSIFISYCREDERQALHLLSLLRNEGFEVWIDQEAIAGASIWSDEIVQNIKSAKIFIALLSAASASSANVAKEIALAAEHGKIILPIEIGSVTLPGRLEYALAGIQRTGFHDEQAIIRAVRSQVARLDGEDSHVDPLTRKQKQKRKLRLRLAAAGVLAVLLVGGYLIMGRRAQAMGDNTVAVLPFSTLNTDNDSTRNLDVFSDELISQLSTLPSLKTSSATVLSDYRDSKLNPLTIARELNTRFIVDGWVRKQNDVNYVSVRVSDAKQGGVVFEDTYSGNNHVVFALRTQVAKQVTGFLNEISNSERALREAEENLKAHPNDATAYYQLGHEANGHDKNRALQLYRKAIELDPTNVRYYMSAGLVSERLGDPMGAREYGHHAIPLMMAKLREHPDSLDLVVNYAIALDLSGQGARSEAIYDSLIRKNPTDNRLIYNAACCAARQAKADRAIDLLEKLFPLAPGRRGEVKYDPDFDNIRSDPRYLQLIYGFGQ